MSFKLPPSFNFFAPFLMTLVVMFNFNYKASAAETGKMKEIHLKTSAYSSMCKNKIEAKLNQQDGVESSFLNLTSKVLTVSFDSAKISEDSVKTVVTKLGYDVEDNDKVKNEEKQEDKEKKIGNG